MSSDSIDDTPTNLALPKSDATLTIRVIKSFEFRTEKSLVLHHVNLEQTTVGQLKDTVRQGNLHVHLTFTFQPRKLRNLCFSDTDTAWMEAISYRRSRSLRSACSLSTASSLTGYSHRHLEAIYQGARCQGWWQASCILSGERTS